MKETKTRYIVQIFQSERLQWEDIHPEHTEYNPAKSHMDYMLRNMTDNDRRRSVDFRLVQRETTIEEEVIL